MFVCVLADEKASAIQDLLYACCALLEAAPTPSILPVHACFRPFALVQVQLLYDLTAQKGKGRLGEGSTHDDVNASADKQTVRLAASEDTTRVLTRLAEQASAKMSLAADKTDFKDAALWRDRRDALLSTVQQLEPEVSREAASM